MIDLDILAESRANQLGQDHEAWRKAVWTTAFHKLSQTLTDGEIESFFESCRTVNHFETMTKYLTSDVPENGITFSQVMDKVARSGYQMEEWVDSIVEIANFAKTKSHAITFFEILMLIHGCATRAAPQALPLVAAVQGELKHGLLERK